MKKILTMLMTLLCAAYFSPPAALAADEAAPEVSQRAKTFIALCPELPPTGTYLSYFYDPEAESSYKAVREFDVKISSLLRIIEEEKKIISGAEQAAAVEDEARHGAKGENSSTVDMGIDLALMLQTQKEARKIRAKMRRIDLEIRADMLSALIEIAGIYERYQELIDAVNQEYESSPDDYRGPYGVWLSGVAVEVDLSPVERERDTETHPIWREHISKAQSRVTSKLGYAARLDELRGRYFSSIGRASQAEAVRDSAQLSVAGEYLELTLEVLSGASSGNIEYLKSALRRVWLLGGHKTNYEQGETISVKVSGINEQMLSDRAFVAVYRAGSAHEQYEEYKYLQGPGASTLTFIAPEYGLWEVRLYNKNKQYDDATFETKTSFSVGGAASRLSP